MKQFVELPSVVAIKVIVLQNLNDTALGFCRVPLIKVKYCAYHTFKPLKVIKVDVGLNLELRDLSGCRLVLVLLNTWTLAWVTGPPGLVAESKE